jgi:hypothetical protein
MGRKKKISFKLNPEWMFKENLISGSGYIFFYRKSEEKMYVWEYEIKPDKKDKSTNRTHLSLISEGGIDERTLTEIIDSNSKWNQTEFYKDLPIFFEKINNFDTQN